MELIGDAVAGLESLQDCRFCGRFGVELRGRPELIDVGFVPAPSAKQLTVFGVQGGPPPYVIDEEPALHSSIMGPGTEAGPGLFVNRY